MAGGKRDGCGGQRVAVGFVICTGFVESLIDLRWRGPFFEKVDQSLHGRLIGAKGTLKKMMELESGAHIVYRTEPEPCCQVCVASERARE